MSTVAHVEHATGVVLIGGVVQRGRAACEHDVHEIQGSLPSNPLIVPEKSNESCMRRFATASAASVVLIEAAEPKSTVAVPSISTVPEPVTAPLSETLAPWAQTDRCCRGRC